MSDSDWSGIMANHRNLAVVVFAGAIAAISTVDVACAQQAIGSAATTQNQVTRELGGASAPLTAGDSVFRNEAVKTGSDSLAKLVFLDSTNLAVGPTSRVVLDRFVYEGDLGAQKISVNLAKGIFRFTTGNLDKKAYTIDTPTAAIGVRGTVLDIDVRSTQTRATLIEGRAFICARKAGVTLEQQVRACLAGAGRCDCEVIDHPGQTALVKKVGGTNQAGPSSSPVNFASLCSGAASLCSSDSSYASNALGGGGGALCGR